MNTREMIRAAIGAIAGLLFAFFVLGGATAFGQTNGGLLPALPPQFQNAANGKLCTQAAGTTTALALYSDSALTSALPTVISLNALGRPTTSGGTETALYVQARSYKISLYTAGSSGTCNGQSVGALVWTRDNIYDLATFYKLVFATLVDDKVCHASQATGTTPDDASGKIAYCINSVLPSTGGTVDARGLEGTQTLSTNMLAGCSISKPITLLLGASNFNTSTTQTATSCGSLQIIGTSGGGDLQTGTTITWTGTSGGTVLFFDTTRDSRVENISIKPSATIGIGILSDNLHASGSAVSTNIYFKTVSVGAATTGIQLGKDQTDGNNAEMTFEDVYLTGAGTYGYYVKFSQSKNLNFVRGSIEDKDYGIYHNNGASHVYGMNFSSIGVADLYYGANQDNIFVEGCHDEFGAAFLKTAGYSGENYAAYLSGNSWVGTVSTVNPMIEYKFAGPLVMTGNDWTVGSYLATPKFNISTTSAGGTVIISTGNIFPNALVFTGAVNSYSLTSIGDRTFTPANAPTTMPNVTQQDLGLTGNLAVTGLVSITSSLTAATIGIGGDALQNHLLAGTYTPTLTNVDNIASSTARLCSYMQIGKTVSVSGYITVSFTATGTVTSEIDLSVPVLNGLNIDTMGGSAVNEASGLVGASAFRIFYGNTNKARFIADNIASATSADYFFSFQYHLNWIAPLFLPFWRRRRKSRA